MLWHLNIKLFDDLVSDFPPIGGPERRQGLDLGITMSRRWKSRGTSAYFGFLLEHRRL